MSTKSVVLTPFASLKPKRMDIPLDKILPSRYQPRDEAYERKEDLEQLAHLIEIAGLDPVPEVRPHPEKPGFYEMIKGHRRKKSIEMFLRSWRSVPCDVVEGLSEDDVLFRVGQDNSGRRAFYPYEKGKYFKMWSKKVSADEIASKFGVKTRAVWEWMRLADDIDFLVGPLDTETRNNFILSASREIIDEIKKIKNLNDRVEACKMAVEGAGLESIRAHALASTNSTQRGARGVSADDDDSDKEHPLKSILATLKEGEKAENYDELRRIHEKLKRDITPTLDKYIEFEETMRNPKDSAIIRVVKPGTMHVIHQVDARGNGLCIHQTKNGKKPIVAKFKIDV